jgi:hypothetical protein
VRRRPGTADGRVRATGRHERGHGRGARRVHPPRSRLHQGDAAEEDQGLLRSVNLQSVFQQHWEFHSNQEYSNGFLLLISCMANLSFKIQDVLSELYATFFFLTTSCK